MRPIHCVSCDLLIGRVFPQRETTATGAMVVVGYTFECAVDTLHKLDDRTVECPGCHHATPMMYGRLS